MKLFKKALAVLLAVLMVAFSVPFSALAADEIITVQLHTYQYIGVDYFGPYVDPADGQAEELSLDTQLYAGDVIAVVFGMNMTNHPLKGMGIKGHYDTSRIVPAYYYKQGRQEKLQSATYTTASVNNASNVIGMNNCTVANDATYNFGFSYFSNVNKNADGWPEFMIAQNSNGGVYGTLTGKSSSEAIGDFDYTVIHGQGFEVMKDMTVADLYDAIRANTDIDNNSILTTSNGDATGQYQIPVRLAPAGGSDPEPAEITYTYLNGDVTTIKEGEAAPAVTATKTEHVADTETHKTTTYAWEADGENAFKEVATETTGNCTFKTKTPAQEYIHTKDQLQNGITAVETCTACGFEKGGEVTVAKHTYVKTEVAATCKVLAHDHFECECGDAYDENFTGELAAHDWQPTGNTRGDADCQTPGEVEFKCSVCQETKWEDGALGAHQLTKVEEVPATCTTAGTGEYYTCDVCHKMFADANAATEITEVPVIDALDHSFTNYVSNNNATCQKNATETAKCDRCDAEDTREILNSTVAHKFTVEGATTPGTCVDKAETVWSCEFGCGETTIVYGNVDPANHKNVVVDKDSAKAPTRAEAGKEADEVCTACGTVVKEGAVIPALGVDITVTGSSLGTATINGEAIANATKNVAYASAYTLTATANEGAEFLGWKVGNKIVSEETTYTTNAYADMTYVPVFAAAAGEFTVTFVDAYGNVVATVASTELPLAALPTAPAFAGLTFAGWDMTLEEVNALTASAKVIAAYDNDTVKTYTVSAPEGTTIVVDGVESTGSVEVTYNTKITVKADGATAWTVNGSTEPAAYGPEYTFYCGSDITVAPVTDVVTAKPAVEVVNKDVDGYKVTFLATRSVPAGYKLVESGFVYGKGMNADDLVLENVGKVAGSANGTVKQIVCNNKGVDGQFALSYGVKNMDASASAAAYVIYSVGGQSVVIYDFMSHDYNV